MIFCDDTDLLLYEPGIFVDAAWASQALLVATGTLAGTTLALTAGSAAGVPLRPRHVVTLDGTFAGSYPLVAVVDSTHLTVSRLYEDLFPDNGEPLPIAIGSATGVNVVVRTFGPQIATVSQLIARAAGLADTLATSPTLINADALRRAAVLGTLQAIYNALAATGAAANLATRADAYALSFQRALRAARIELDTNNDGVADTVRQLSVVKLLRA